MKLVDIWNSSQSWTTLAALKKPPRLAYRLLKYQKKVNAEYEVCEAQRQKLVYECAGVAPPTPPDILIVQISNTVEGPDGSQIENPQFAELVEKFNEFLATDSDLSLIDITMDELIDSLDAEKGNVLSEMDLSRLEVFFTPVTPPAT